MPQLKHQPPPNHKRIIGRGQGRVRHAPSQLLCLQRWRGERTAVGAGYMKRRLFASTIQTTTRLFSSDMARFTEVLLLAIATVTFGVHGAAIPVIYLQEQQPAYLERMSPVVSGMGNGRAGLGAVHLAPLTTIPISSPITVHRLTKQGLPDSERSFINDGRERQDSYLHLGTHGRGNGFLLGNDYSNQDVTAGQSGSTSTGAYLANNRHVGNIMTSSGHLKSAGTEQKSQQGGGQYESGQSFVKDNKFKLENALNNGFKKGHHSHGFQSSYHKDESGHNTQFYDDDHIEGQHAGSHDVKNFFDARGRSQIKNQGGQDNFQGVSHAQNQHFETALNERAKSGQHQDHVNEELYDQRNNYNADSAGSIGSEEQSKYGLRPIIRGHPNINKQY